MASGVNFSDKIQELTMNQAFRILDWSYYLEPSMASALDFAHRLWSYLQARILVYLLLTVESSLFELSGSPVWRAYFDFSQDKHHYQFQKDARCGTDR